MKYLTRLFAFAYILLFTMVPAHAIMVYMDPVELYVTNATIGASIPIEVSNTGTEDVWILEQGGCHNMFNIFDESGEELILTAPDTMCTMEFRTSLIASGETKVIGTWNQKAYKGTVATQVPAGTYSVTTSYTTDSSLDTTYTHTISYSFTISGGSQTTFSDVPRSYWAYDHIMFLYNEGIAQGYGNGTFKPDWNITKAEVVKIALNAAGIPTNTYIQAPSPYKDVSASHSLAYYIDTAKSRGFLPDEDYFHPDDKATRFFTLQVLIDALGQTPNIQAYAEEQSAFSDVSVSNTQEKAYTNYAAEAGIVSGYDDGTYRPNSNVTRAEMAKIVHNLN